VLSEAAEGLFKFAHSQFVQLARVTDDLVDWLQRIGFNNVAIIESPLGNCVPVSVITRLAKARGLKIEVVEWGFPRNASVGRGYNVKDAARKLAAEPLIVSADCVLFVDDALTGS